MANTDVMSFIVNNLSYLVGILGILVIIMYLLIINLLYNLNYMKKRYKKMMTGVDGANLERMMIGFEDEMTQGCIGSLSELYDGNPPFTGRGAVSFATNVGGVLRVLRLLKNLNI